MRTSTRRRTRPRTPDLTIDGQGFYQITGQTARGRRFMRQVDGNDHGTAYSDQTGLTQAIADGAVAAGLRVAVNGLAYLGAADGSKA